MRTTASETTVQWRTRFQQFLSGASAAAAVGALGLGTESIVKPVYEQILAGLRQVSSLRRPDYVFFELHCLVDEQHQLDLLEVASELATSPAARRDLRGGMLMALSLRGEMWDTLYRRATASDGRRYA